MAIINKFDLGNLEVGTKYYFKSNTNMLIDDFSRAHLQDTHNIVETIDEFDINILDEGDGILYNKLYNDGYYLKKILIYPNKDTDDDKYLKIKDGLNKISINSSEIDITNKIFEGYNKIGDGKLNVKKEYEIILPEIFFGDNSTNTIKIKINLKGYEIQNAAETPVNDVKYKFGVVFGNKLESKLDGLYEYNQINEMVKKLMNNRDKLLEQNSKNQTIIRARELIKKKIEFHKYWINILYEIIFYTHLVLVVIVILMLLYKLL